MVETVSGKTEAISKCRKFSNGWYLVGDLTIENSGDCYEIDGRFNRVEVGNVIFDHHLKRYVMKNDALYHGVIDLVENVPVFGAFSPNEELNGIVILEGKNHVRVLNTDVFKGSRQYRERLSDGKFYHISTLSAAEFSRIVPPRGEYKTSLPYDASQVLDQYVARYEALDVKILPNIAEYAPFLKDLTFGLEFETIAGTLPQKVLNTTGLIPLRDGSIQGIEYVTVPMVGAKGFQTTLNAVKELAHRTKYDESCAVHMHIGNIPRTPEFILAFFKVTCAIQDELYTLFPLYKKYNFGVKSKNYTKPFPATQLLAQMHPVIDGSNIKHNFDILYQYLSMGESFHDKACDLKNVTNHPADRDGRAKWHINTRYHIHNLIPLIFGNKQTVEFRIHTATLDVNKVAYFMMLNAAIVNYTIENTAKILKEPALLTYNGFGLGEIVQTQANKIFKNRSISDRFVDTFYGYLNLRKKRIEEQSRNGDFKGDEDNIPSPTRIKWFQEEVKEVIENTSVTEELGKKFNHLIERLERDFASGRFSRQDYERYKERYKQDYIVAVERARMKVTFNDNTPW